MRKISLLIATFAIVFVFIAGCAAFQKVKEPVKVEMVLLTEILYMGEPAGVKGPAIFGDFTVTHYVNVLPAGDFWLLEFIPMLEETRTIFMLWAKSECPEAIALYAYNMDTEEDSYWIYDSEGQAWETDEETYDFFLELDHPCAVEMPEGIDATLHI